jgi:mandelate racemase
VRAVKAKIGYPTVEEDLAVVRAIRDAVGEATPVMVDFNQSLSPTEAASRMSRLEDLGLAWIEEPILAEDYAGMARLASRFETPVQAGENWWGPLEFQKAMDAGLTELLMPDVMKVFGVTGWMDVAAMAAVRRVPVSCHLFPEVSAHLLAATPTAHWLEYADWWSSILEEPLSITDGMASPSTGPGCGIAWDERAIARL